MKKALFQLKIVAILAAVLALPAGASAANTDWKGTNSANWSDGGNWTAGAPINGSTVQFNASSTGNLVTNNDLSLTLAGINENGTPTAAVTIGGNGFTLSGGINMTGAGQDLTVGVGANDVALSTTQIWTQTTGRTLTVNSNKLYLSDSVAAHTLTLTVASGSGTTAIGSIIADSSASGAAASSLSVGTTGTSNTGANVRLSGNSTYSGGSTLNGRATHYQLGSSTVLSGPNIVSGPFGTGTVTIINNNQVQNLEAFGADRTVANAFNLNSGGFNFSGTNNLTLTGPIGVNVSRAITYNPAAVVNLTINGDITMGTTGAAGGTLTTAIVANTTTTTGIMIINGNIKEVAGVTSGAIVTLSNGNGTNAISVDQLNGQNTYTGNTNLNGQASTVQVGSSSIISGPNIVSGPLGTGTVVFNNAITAPRIEAVGGAQTVANAVTLTSNGAVQGSNDLTLSGVITGAGVLQKKGTGNLTLTGVNGHGTTKLFDGGLKLGNKSALGSGTFTIGDATTSSTLKVSSTGNLTGANAVGNAVTVAKDFTVASGSSDLEFSGGVSLGTANRIITVDSSNATILSGTVADTGGTGGITKAGIGVLTLKGANTYGGNTTVSAGTLLANNTTGSATGGGSVSVEIGATLGGTGAVSGAVTVNDGGTLSPGASIESLGTGAVTFNSSVTGGSTFKYELNSTLLTADLLNAATGSLTISTTGLGVTLALSDLGASLVPDGTKFTLISYNGTLNSGGMFAGVPELGLVTVGPKQFRIRYKDATAGGNFTGETALNTTGRFVTLTAVPEFSSLVTMGLVGCFAVSAVWVGKRYKFNAFNL